MKKVINLLFFLLLLNGAPAQNVVRFFQHRFNLNYASPQLRDEQFNSGIVTWATTLAVSSRSELSVIDGATLRFRSPMIDICGSN